MEGFTSETLFLPNEDVYVVMLLNTESRIPLVALSRIVASMVINKPYSFTEVALEAKDLKKYIGVYRNKFDELINITEQHDTLFFQRPGGTRYQIKHSLDNQFFFDKDYLWVEFHIDSLQRINELTFSQVGIGLTIWKKTNKPILRLYPEKIPDSLINQYVGKYVLSENDTAIIERKFPNLLLLTRGEKKTTLIPNSKNSYSAIDDNSVLIEFQILDGKVKAIFILPGRKNKIVQKLLN